MTIVTDELLLTAAEILRVSSLPVVLALEPRYESTVEAKAAQETGLRTLRERGLVDEYGDVADELASALATLGQPDRQLVARSFGQFGMRRVCLARLGGSHTLAVRDGDEVDVRDVWADDNPVTLARTLSEALGPRTPAADITTFRADAASASERFDAARESADFSDIAYHFGVTGRAAVEFGLAMSTCHTHTEIVCYGGDSTRAPGAVAVYDTEHGRIIGVPDHSPADPEAWLTFAPGSDRRFAQAIATLIEAMPGGRWMP
jgi:hypothetical protein